MNGDDIAAGLYVVAVVAASYQLARYARRGPAEPFGWWRR